MPTTQTMTEEQRRAMFARMNGGNAAAARNPYKPEPVSGWEVFKGGLSGFAEGAANGIANIFNSASFGLTDAVGITHTYQQTGWDSEVSKIAADIGVIAASFALSGAGKAVEKTGGTLGKQAMAQQAAKKAAAKEAAKKATVKEAEGFGNAVKRAVGDWAEEMKWKWGLRGKPPQATAQTHFAREMEKAQTAQRWKNIWKDQLENQFNRRPQFLHPEAPAVPIERAGNGIAALRGAVAGLGVAKAYIAQDVTRSKVAKYKERKDAEGYARRAYEIIHGEQLPKEQEARWFADQGIY